MGTISVYINGALAATLTGITEPLSTIGNQFAYVGRSLYTSDAYLNWSLQEFRIYNGALSPSDIAASDALGPGQLLSNASPRVSAVNERRHQFDVVLAAGLAGFYVVIEHKPVVRLLDARGIGNAANSDRQMADDRTSGCGACYFMLVR